MLGIIFIIVVTIAMIAASYFGVVMFWVPRLIDTLQDAAGSSSEQMKDDIEKFDVELERAMGTVSNLRPLDDFFEAQSKLKELQASIEEESGKMGKIEKLVFLGYSEPN